MPAVVFFLLLVGLWMVALFLFVWTHLPERTIAEIIRALESRSWRLNALVKRGDRATMGTWSRRTVRNADRRSSGRWHRSSRGTPTGDVSSAARYGMKFGIDSSTSGRGNPIPAQPRAAFVLVRSWRSRVWCTRAGSGRPALVRRGMAAVAGTRTTWPAYEIRVSTLRSRERFNLPVVAGHQLTTPVHVWPRNPDDQ